MKKKIYSLFITLSLVGLVISPSTVLAVDLMGSVCTDNPTAAACQDSGDATPQNKIYGPNGVLTKVAKLISVVVGAAAVIMIILGGFKYIISSGDPGNTKAAKDTILFAVVGIFVALFAQFIVLFVLNKL